MINSNVTKINRTINLENTKDTKLSIQFNLDGFSFCISDNSTGEILYFFKNLFEDKQTTPENLMQKVFEILEDVTRLVDIDGWKLDFYNGPTIDISASDIKKWIKNNKE
jgi:hypothetical protein